MSYAVLFPGQGSQFVGMGADLFDEHPDLLLDEADEILGWSLRSLCLDGPQEELTRTERAQPALYSLGYAMWRSLVPHLNELPSAAAGHSLGEYTALAASGVLKFGDGLKLVAERGRAMAHASDLEASGMAALIGVDPEQAETIVAERRSVGDRIWVANLNAPGQIVVAGATSDLDHLTENGRSLGIRRVIRLNVAGAFHSPFMASAQAAVSRALSMIDCGTSDFPVWSNVSASPVEDVVSALVQQIVAPVLFSDTLAGMAREGIATFVHVGPGDVTAGMAKRTVSGAHTLVVNEHSSAAAMAQEISEIAEEATA